MTATKNLGAIQSHAIESLRTYLHGSDEERAGVLRDVASDFVDAREHFFTKEGEPDWRGRTYAYRRWVRETMSLANVPPETIHATQAAIRYHVGNVLRDRLDHQTVEALGLLSESPRERSVEKRERHSAVLSVFGGGGPLSEGETVFALMTMEATLARITPESLAGMGEGDLAVVSDLADRLCSLARRVAGGAPKDSRK